MDDVLSAIVSDLAGFLSFVATGYIFLCCYQYASYIPRETEKEHLFIKCVSLSCLFIVLAKVIVCFAAIDSAYTLPVAFGAAILSGLLSGRIHRTAWANDLSQHIFKRELERSSFVYIWELANKDDSIVFLQARTKAGQDIYDGQIYKVFPQGKDPEILLAYYRHYDAEGVLVDDFSQVDGAYLLIRYSDIQCLEYELDHTSA